MPQPKLSLTPFGVRDLLPGDVAIQEKILAIATGVFEKRGYQKIITPSIEYYDTIGHALGETLTQKAVKFVDPEGQTLILRPDYTTPIARVAATRLADAPKPIKVYYTDTVFRKPDHQLDDAEIVQAGIERIGESTPESDAEVISIACEILLKLGFKEFGIDIGHVDFVAGLSPDQKQSLLTGNYLKFGQIPKRGGLELVKDQKELTAIYHILDKMGFSQYVQFNQGLVKDIGYYSGIVFECFVKGIGTIIGSGGRYDHLIEKFGTPTPAVGFSLNINQILAHTELLEIKK